MIAQAILSLPAYLLDGFVGGFEKGKFKAGIIYVYICAHCL